MKKKKCWGRGSQGRQHDNGSKSIPGTDFRVKRFLLRARQAPPLGVGLLTDAGGPVGVALLWNLAVDLVWIEDPTEESAFPDGVRALPVLALLPQTGRSGEHLGFRAPEEEFAYSA